MLRGVKTLPYLMACRGAFRPILLKTKTATSYNYFEYNLTGSFPNDGGVTTETVKIANITASMTMKGIVLGERYKEKDAYDIYYLVKHYQNGPQGAANEVKQCCNNQLVQESIDYISQNFRNRDSSGPKWVATFLGYEEEDDQRERIITDAYMNVQEFLEHYSDNPSN